jgi:uncharacterized protein YutE (UPF0331/DUF86 family)
MTDVVIINKVERIERCLKRIAEDYAGYEAAFLTDYMRQDAVILNLQRACELSSIGLANHILKKKHLGVPQSSAHSFELLSQNHLISQELATQMVKMVGFHNVAIHEYAILDILWWSGK